MVILSLPIALLLLINSPKVQTHLTNYIASQVKTEFGVDIKIERVDFSFFDRLLLKNILILDHKQDTLIFAERLSTKISKINLNNGNIKIGRTTLNGGYMRIYRYPDESMNIKEFVKAFKKDTVKRKSSLNLEISKVELFNTKFVYQRYNREPKDYGMNYRDIVVTDINANIDNFSVKSDTVSFYSNILQGKEQCGLILEDFSGQVSLHDTYTHITKGKLRSPKSFVVVNELDFRYNDYLDYIDFITNVKIDVDFDYSNVNFNSLSYFSPSLKNNDFRTLFQGKVKGKVENLKGHNVLLKLGKYTEIDCDFNIKGLPDYKNSFYIIDIKNIYTSANDFKSVMQEFTDNKLGELPNEVLELGLMSFKGNVTGFFDDIVAYGDLTSNVGSLRLDMSVKNKDKIYLNGLVKSDGFNIGQITHTNPTINNISFNTNLNAELSKNSYAVNTESVISSFNANNYNYQNITVKGNLKNNAFDGLIFCNDPNLNFNFLGELNYSKENPFFVFNAKLNKANLSKLNFWEKDSLAEISFDMTSNFKGVKFEDINGTLDINNPSITINNNNFKLKNIKIYTENTPDRKNLQLKSSIIDAQIGGNFSQNALIQSITNLYKSYFPAYSNSNNSGISIFQNDSTSFLAFNTKIHNINDLLYTVHSKIKVDSNTNISAQLDFKNKTLALNGSTNYFQYDDELIRNLNLNISNIDSTLFLKFNAESFNYGPNITLRNPQINCSILPNTIDLGVNWNNLDSINYSGNINATINSKRDSANIINTIISVHPSNFTISNKEWTTSEGEISIKPNYLDFSKLTLFRNNESATINGIISTNISDTLSLNLKNLDASQLNLYTQNFGIKLNGFFNGNAKITNIYQQPMFLSNLEATDISLNDSLIGNVEIISKWNNIDKAVNFRVKTFKDNLTPFKVTGSYRPKNHEIKTICNVNNFRINLLSNLVKDQVSDVNGFLSGNINIEGSTKEPIINGNLNFKNTTLKVNYTNTNYHFNDSLTIFNNNILFNNFRIIDDNNNYASLSGTVFNKNFKELDINTTIEYNELQVLNTQQIHNDRFYGKVFLSGIIQAKGNPKDITLTIQTTTQKGTEIFVPLTSESNLSQSSIVNFVSAKAEKTEYIPEEWRETVANTKTNMNLHLDLKITPEAKAQLIIDSKIGDVINGQGNGDLQIDMQKDKPLKMFGDYIFEKGDYLFTLQNIFNKKFNIASGSNIVWTGNPSQAKMDLTALYSTKSTLSQIFPDDSARYSRRIPVNCIINMRGDLATPNINFDINLPTADSETQARLENLINTEEKRNKQFLSLLLINSFYPETNTIGYASSSNQIGSTGINTTASDLLSNQLSLWLSQLSKDFDIGVNYRPGDEISKDEVEVALSTQLLNDRVTISGNVDYGGNKINNQAITGEFNIEVKANKKGTVKFKGFNRANDQMLYQTSPNTQGVGISYTEDFNTFGELWRKYKSNIVNLFTSKKRKQLNQQKDSVSVSEIKNDE